jgi:O-antigen ligase
VNNKLIYNKQIYFIFLCMSLSVLTLSTIVNVSKYAQIILIGYLLFSSLLVILKLTKKIVLFELKILFCLLAFILFQLVGCLQYFEYYSLVSIVQTLLMILFFLYIVNIEFNNFKYLFIRVITVIFIFIGYVESYISYTGLFGSKNTFAGIFLFLSLINIVLSMIENKKIGYILTIFIMPLLYSSTSRTSLFVFFIVIFSYFLLLKFKPQEKSFILIFILIMVVLFFIMFVYPNIENISFYNILNEYSTKWFGKNVLSGRNIIWQNILISLKDDIILGHGTGYIYNNIIANDTRSAHNQYLQLLLQNGLVGLFLFITLLFIIWITMVRKSNDKVILFCITCFIGIILYNTFECSLIQNKVAIGGMQWLILGIGVGRSLRSN